MSLARTIPLAGTIVSILAVLFSRAFPWIRTQFLTRSVNRRLGADLPPTVDLEHTLASYIQPECQFTDPESAEEPEYSNGSKKLLWPVLNDIFMRPTEHRFIFLLADSGMGKTSALLNYYARHVRRVSNRYRMSLVFLGSADADERIASVPEKSQTILLLDGLEEDVLAGVDYRERIRMLLQSTHGFYKVLISCRTHFFPSEEEIPHQTGQKMFGARAAGHAPEYYFDKVYLAPFTDVLVKKYLRKLYPVWRYPARRSAYQLVSKIHFLTARPMLLAHVDELHLRSTWAGLLFSVSPSQIGFAYRYELYEEMVAAWITREAEGSTSTVNLREFSDLLAVQMLRYRRVRGTERVPKQELSTLSKQWGIPIDDIKLPHRSLLNRDAEGNYKFAHRSIMEYLAAKRFFEGDLECLEIEWTDEMSNFYREMLQANSLRGSSEPPFRRLAKLLEIPNLGIDGSKIVYRSVLEATTSVAADPRKATTVVRDEHQGVTFGEHTVATILLAICLALIDPRGRTSIELLEQLDGNEIIDRTGDSRRQLRDLRSLVSIPRLMAHESRFVTIEPAALQAYRAPSQSLLSMMRADAISDVDVYRVALNPAVRGRWGDCLLVTVKAVRLSILVRSTERLLDIGPYLPTLRKALLYLSPTGQPRGEVSAPPLAPRT